MASPAITTVTSITMNGRTRKFAFADPLLFGPKKMSFGVSSWTLIWARVTRRTTANRSGANGETGIRRGSRPKRIPAPMPRKLAMSRKLLK